MSLATHTMQRVTAVWLSTLARDQSKFAASKIPDSKLIIYDTAGHLLVGHEKTVRIAVRSFLAAAGRAADPQPKSD